MVMGVPHNPDIRSVHQPGLRTSDWSTHNFSDLSYLADTPVAALYIRHEFVPGCPGLIQTQFNRLGVPK